MTQLARQVILEEGVLEKKTKEERRFKIQKMILLLLLLLYDAAETLNIASFKKNQLKVQVQSVILCMIRYAVGRLGVVK